MNDSCTPVAPEVEVAAREPISPELVLVCPELAPPLERDPSPGVAQAPLIRPPSVAAEKTGRSNVRSDLHTRAPTPAGAALSGRGRGLRVDLSTYAIVLAGVAAVGILSWRSLLQFTEAKPLVAPLPPHTVSAAARTSSSAAPAVPAAAKRESVAATERTRSSHSAPTENAATVTGPATVRRAGVKLPKAADTKQGVDVEPAGLPDTRRPTGPLLAPEAGQRVVGRPQLTWDPIADVWGYRLSLYRGTRQILVLVSHEPKVVLADSWRFNGRRVELTPGTYRWYVWPIPQAGQQHVQHLLKASSFVLVPQP